MTPKHNPEIFEVRTPRQAREIILTRDGASTDERWRRETPYLVDLIGAELNPTQESVILDYGCGVGRLARGLIEGFGCSVIGVDSSLSMRALSLNYVRSDRFMVMGPEYLDWLIREGVRVDGAISVWVLQHCLKPHEDIDRIRRAMTSKARLFVLNNLKRCVPTDVGWIDDGIEIGSGLLSAFDRISEGAPDTAHTSKMVARHARWATYVGRET